MKNCSNRSLLRQNHCIRHTLETSSASAAALGAKKINKFGTGRDICKIICLTLVLGATAGVEAAGETAGKFFYTTDTAMTDDTPILYGNIHTLGQYGIYGSATQEATASAEEITKIYGGYDTAAAAVTNNTLTVGSAVALLADSELSAGYGNGVVGGAEEGLGNKLNIAGDVTLADDGTATFYGGYSTTAALVGYNKINVAAPISIDTGVKKDITLIGGCGAGTVVSNNEVTL
ncbi:MAG: hypothetical protein LBB12_00795, partial [Holosporaceae bacterium]|nr:hypothetical protein [Holosporaceae bacterium]